LSLPFFSYWNKSALINSQNIPTPDLSSLDDLTQSQEAAHAVWVPNRNGIFVHIASGFAEANDLDTVLVGFNREEAVTFPDNSKDFLESLNQSLKFSTREKVKVYSYTMEWNKTEIVKKIKTVDPHFPFHYLWSCYLNGEKRCERCESCLRFFRALNS